MVNAMFEKNNSGSFVRQTTQSQDMNRSASQKNIVGSESAYRDNRMEILMINQS